MRLRLASHDVASMTRFVLGYTTGREGRAAERHNIVSPGDPRDSAQLLDRAEKRRLLAAPDPLQRWRSRTVKPFSGRSTRGRRNTESLPGISWSRGEGIAGAIDGPELTGVRYGKNGRLMASLAHREPV